MQFLRASLTIWSWSGRSQKHACSLVILMAILSMWTRISQLLPWARVWRYRNLIITLLDFILHLFLDCAFTWDRSKFFISSVTQSRLVVLRWSLCLVLSTSIVMQFFMQSISVHSTWANHLHPSFLITRLAGSSPNNSRISTFFCWLSETRLLVVMIWLEFCTSYSSSCHHHFHHH